MAITSLTTISTAAFKGGRGLSGTGSTSLVGRLNTIINKVNELITNDGVSDTLDIGSGSGTYYGSSDSFFQVDGTNPPTMSRFRIQETTDGSWKTVVCTSGSLVVN